MMPIPPDYMELAQVKPRYVLHVIRGRHFEQGQVFNDGADAVEAAMEFATQHKQGLALLQRPEYPKAHWTMFKWSEMHDNVVPISVTVDMGAVSE